MMKATPPALLLSRADIARVLSLADCIEVVEGAFAAHARGESFAPGLLHGDGLDGEFHIKAGGLQQPRPVFATKINGGFFQNPTRHELPAIQGLIVLQDAANGVPLAVMESGLVTRLRTAAATGVAARHLAAPDAGTVTLCGVGNQAALQLQALRQVRPLRKVFVWSRNAVRARSFAAAQGPALGLKVSAVEDLGTATRDSQVIVTCTPAQNWFLGQAQVSPGTFIAAIGADSPEKQELEPALVAASAVVTDLTTQCAQVGELHHAIAAGLMHAGQVRAELGEIILGRQTARRNPAEILLFDSTGTALQDAAAAALAYTRALAANLGTRFPFWG